MSKWKFYWWVMSSKINKSKGLLLLGLLLILFGLCFAFKFDFAYQNWVFGLGAVLAGVLVILDR